MALALGLVAAPMLAHADGVETVLYEFPAAGKHASNPPHGGSPNGDLLELDGEFYGLAAIGGGNEAPGCGAGCGVLYSITPDGNQKRLWSFGYNQGAPVDDGNTPFGGLVYANEAFYGVTQYGGGGAGCGFGCGTIFIFLPGHGYLGEYAFQGGANDGLYPTGAPLYDHQNFYGTTYGGGSGCGGAGCGVVYEASLSGQTIDQVQVIYNFQGGNDGAEPTGPLIKLSHEYYGETLDGGGAGCGSNGCGTVFSVDSAGDESVIYAFKGGQDGETPERGLLVVDKKLYGVTYNGGGGPCGDVGCGTVFSLTPDGKEKVLYRFTGGTDGSNPHGGLVELNGTLYGTTEHGGVSGTCAGYGCGTVFSITPKGRLKTLYAFTGALNNGTDGCFPEGALTAFNGALYGTTTQCGKPLKSAGTVFRIDLK